MNDPTTRPAAAGSRTAAGTEVDTGRSLPGDLSATARRS